MSSTCSNINALVKSAFCFIEGIVKAVLAVQRSLFPLHLPEQADTGKKDWLRRKQKCSD